MYKTILLTLDGTPTDRAIIEHVKQLAKLTQGHVILLHVADGWAARTFGSDAISPEVTEDSDYLKKVCDEFQTAGIATEVELAFGDPPKEILKWVAQKGCDLIAMASHGHRLLGDIFHGSTITQVRHKTSIPILIVRGKKE